MHVFSKQERYDETQIENGKNQRDILSADEHPPILKEIIEIRNQDEQKNTEGHIEIIGPIFLNGLRKTVEFISQQQNGCDEYEYDQVKNK